MNPKPAKRSAKAAFTDVTTLKPPIISREEREVFDGLAHYLSQFTRRRVTWEAAWVDDKIPVVYVSDESEVNAGLAFSRSEAGWECSGLDGEWGHIGSPAAPLGVVAMRIVVQSTPSVQGPIRKRIQSPRRKAA
jgi:hypothetical protein